MDKKTKYTKVKSEIGFVSAAPLPTPDELARFYADVYYQESAAQCYQSTYSDDELAQKNLRANLLMHAVQKARGGREGGRILEVGCGEGFLLKVAHERSFDVGGIDFSEHGMRTFNPDLVDKLRVGDAYVLLDEMIAAGEQVDVCVLQNVVEHVIDPGELLARVSKALPADGLAVITVPNDFSPMQEKIMELGLADREYWFQPPQHLHYFNVDNFQGFAASAGYEVVDMYADFPIEMFLFHSGSNYVLNRDNGKPAHGARVQLDLLLSARGIDPYHQFCQAMCGCGVGRNITVVLRAAGERK